MYIVSCEYQTPKGTELVLIGHYDNVHEADRAAQQECVTHRDLAAWKLVAVHVFAPTHKFVGVHTWKRLDPSAKPMSMDEWVASGGTKD